MKPTIPNFLALLGLVLTLACGSAFAQDDLDKLLSDSKPNEVNYTLATFKATRMVNTHTVEGLRANHLDFRIHHRFGALNTGLDQFWGLDQASIKLSLEYGITDDLMVGIGRSSINKLVDGFFKLKVLKQSTGARNMPVSVSLFGNAGYISTKVPIGSEADGVAWTVDRRMSYAAQLLIARKFNESLSLQLSPSYIHRNVVARQEDQNDLFAVAIGGRYKLTKRLSLTSEYIYQMPGTNRDNHFDSFSAGMDIETGGHVFQLFFTNSMGMVEQQFIAENEGGWGKGTISFGFNISRTFGLSRAATARATEW